MTADHEKALTYAYELHALLHQMSRSPTDAGRVADRARLAMSQLQAVIEALEPPPQEASEPPRSRHLGPGGSRPLHEV